MRLADELPQRLLGDKTRLSQILDNVAGNAIKFTEKGEVSIEVASGESLPGDRREIVFTVADTGIGIADDQKGLLFAAFTQADQSHTRKYGGTGLGLAISKEIVERMGGTISFKSAEGKGSTFQFRVPFGVAVAEGNAEAAPVAGTAADASLPVAERPKTRILQAEDDPTTRQVLKGMLEKAHYEVAFAENGRQLVEMWEQGDYDLILMDVQMPLMNGFQATSAIRQQERTRGGRIPIIAMTGHALKDDEERCLAAGMDAFIAKPIDFKKTLRLIDETLKNAAHNRNLAG